MMAAGFYHRDLHAGNILRDPDGNGVELYYDRPRKEWPRGPDGEIQMFTKTLDLVDLRGA